MKKVKSCYGCGYPLDVTDESVKYISTSDGHPVCADCFGANAGLRYSEDELKRKAVEWKKAEKYCAGWAIPEAYYHHIERLKERLSVEIYSEIGDVVREIREMEKKIKDLKTSNQLK